MSNKAQFKVGDAVVVFGDSNTMYIVTEVYQNADIHDTHKKYFDYEVVKVLPSNNNIQVTILNQSTLLMYADYKSKMWETAMAFIRKDRKSNGINDENGKLPFLEIVEKYYRGNGGITSLSIIQPIDPEDLLGLADRHEKAQTVDELLDALSDFNHFLKMVDGHPKDEDHKKIIESRKKVLSKLKRISKRG